MELKGPLCLMHFQRDLFWGERLLEIPKQGASSLRENVY